MRQLTYDQMMSMSQGVGEALGVLDKTLTGLPEDELTTEVIASALASWVDENIEDEDRI